MLLQIHMEKYLKIHWSIRIILGCALFILILLIIQSIYWLLFYTWIQEVLPIFGSEKGEYLTIPTILFWLIVQGLMIVIIYNVLHYKRWAIMTTFIFIGLPISSIFLWMLWLLIFQFYDYGVEYIQWNNVLIFSILVCIVMLFIWFSVKMNIELIRLYRNIKNIEQIEASKFQDKKPRFLILLIVSMVPIFIVWGLMIILYTPVIPIDIPEWYFKIDRLNLANPTYTDRGICKDFESEIWKINEAIRRVNKDDTHSWVILAKEVLFSNQSNTQNNLNINITNDEKERIKVKEMKKMTEYQEYMQNYPEQWTEALLILRSQLNTESVIQLQKLTRWLPQSINCNIRNDQNISEEMLTDFTQYLKTSRLYEAAIKLALLENNTELSIELLKSFHEFNTKFYNSNTNLLWWVVGNAILAIEFRSAEYIIENTDSEQIEKIREIYTVPYNIKENQINAWKWEYYFFEHMFTGRSKSINQVSIPYLFNWEDTLNRSIILLFASAIADVQNDTKLLQDIEENRKLNNDNFLIPTERSFIGEWLSTWKGRHMLFTRLYNPIGKLLIESLMPSYEAYTSYTKRYNSTELHQDSLRYNLLWIEKNN